MCDAADVKRVPLFRRNERLKLSVALVGTAPIHPAQTHRDAVDMGVDRKNVASQCIHHHALGNFFGNS
jgi:hypothetical protein